jgi:hypothetical protein
MYRGFTVIRFALARQVIAHLAENQSVQLALSLDRSQVLDMMAEYANIVNDRIEVRALAIAVKVFD